MFCLTSYIRLSTPLDRTLHFKTELTNLVGCCASCNSMATIKRLTILTLLFSIIGIAALFTVHIAHAQEAGPQFVPLANYGGSQKLQDLYSTNTGGDLSGFLNKLFTFAISIGGVLAVLRLAWAGYTYMTSDLWSSKEHAKEIIQDTLLGLVLLLAIWLILFQINPNILCLKVGTNGSGCGTQAAAGSPLAPATPVNPAPNAGTNQPCTQTSATIYNPVTGRYEASGLFTNPCSANNQFAQTGKPTDMTNFSWIQTPRGPDGNVISCGAAQNNSCWVGLSPTACGGDPNNPNTDWTCCGQRINCTPSAPQSADTAGDVSAYTDEASIPRGQGLWCFNNVIDKEYDCYTVGTTCGDDRGKLYSGDNFSLGTNNKCVQY